MQTCGDLGKGFTTFSIEVADVDWGGRLPHGVARLLSAPIPSAPLLDRPGTASLLGFRTRGLLRQRADVPENVLLVPGVKLHRVAVLADRHDTQEP